MTNLERWHEFMRDVKAPSNFITAGFYYMIGASLQRKVWLGQRTNFSEMRTFPNQNFILTGPPGVGKGLVIKQVKEILKYHKLRDKTAEELKAEKELREKHTRLEIKASMELYGTTENMFQPSKQFDKAEQTLIQLAPDDTTYQKLLTLIRKAMRVISYQNPEGEKDIYMHCSLAVCLEELSSLFKKNSEELGKFFLNAYDSGDYIYDTKHQGTDHIHNMCVNMIAGTTPTTLETLFDSETIGDGLSARLHFIYGAEERFARFDPASFDTRIIQPFIDHIRVLAGPNLLGECKFTPEALAFMKDHFEVNPAKLRINNSPKLDPWYGRKDAHARKMSILNHFADRSDMLIDIEDCQGALNTLASWEKDMHKAVTFGLKNPIAIAAREILRFVARQGMASTGDIVIGLMDILQEKDIQEALSLLVRSKQLDVKDMASTKQKMFVCTEASDEKRIKRKRGQSPLDDIV